MIVHVEQVDYAYKKDKILDELTLEIDKPGVYGLVAPNGAGKTTLMSVIANLYTPQKGSIHILGMNHTDKDLFKRLSFLQDNAVLYDYLTAYQHLQFVRDVHDLPKKEVGRVVKRLGMETYAHKKVGGYSTGMKQRLLLAIAILPDPDVLLLDEPLNGLDPSSTMIVRETLQQLSSEGKTMLVSSHNLTELDRVTDTIFFLVDGKAVKEDIKDFRIETLSVQVEDSAALTKFLNKQQIDYAKEEKYFVISCVKMTAVEVMRRLFQKNISILDFRKEVTGSEERYKELFEGLVD